MKKITLLALLFALSACDNAENKVQSKSGEVLSSITAGSESEKELQESLKEIEKEENERLQKESENTTTLRFDKLKHDFGDVMPDSDNTTEFVVYNTGDKPLILDDVSASCGCTMPQKPDKPILPGKSDVIKVTFHPKPGQVNEIKKTVTVTANTPDKVHMLEIRAFVKE